MSEENKTEEVKPVVNRRKTVAENAPVIEEVKTEVKTKAKVEEAKVEEAKVEEVKAEEVKAEEVKAEEVKVKEVKPVAKEKTAKEIFEASIAKTPYTVFQNGTLVFTYNAYHDIKLTEKYFEINFKKYSYNGIEVKHG